MDIYEIDHSKYSTKIKKVILVWTKENGLILNLPYIGFDGISLKVWKQNNKKKITNFKNFIKMKELEKKLKIDLQFIIGCLRTRAIDTKFIGNFDELTDINLKHKNFSNWNWETRENHNYDLGQYNALKEALRHLKESLNINRDDK